MLKNLPIHLSANCGGVGWCWLSEQWLEPQNTPEILGFGPLGPTTKRSINFLIIIAKVMSSQTFFVESFFPTCLV